MTRPVDELAARRRARQQAAERASAPRTVPEALHRADYLLVEALTSPEFADQLLVDGEATRELLRQVDRLIRACIQTEQHGESR